MVFGVCFADMETPLSVVLWGMQQYKSHEKLHELRVDAFDARKEDYKEYAYFGGFVSGDVPLQSFHAGVPVCV